MCWTRLGNSYSKCKASIKQMAATFQVFMQYKIFESYCVFNGQYHEYIKNVQNLKKTENQIQFIQKLLKYWLLLFKLHTAKKH